MKNNNFINQKAVFKKSSTTYYYSSLFFPKYILEKVTTLYAFVRVADDFVDQIPPQVNSFKSMVKKTWAYFDQPATPKTLDEKIISDFVELAKKNKIPKTWVAAFFRSMYQDIPKKGRKITYRNFHDLEKYIYGSAKIIGLMMCKILKLPEEAYSSAKKQGAAMQLINFVRDLNEDCQFGRSYLSSFQSNINNEICDLKNNNSIKTKELNTLVKNALAKYQQTQKEAEAGYRFIPYRYRIPIVTAAKLYEWTAKKIENNPQIIFEKKVKPTKSLVFLTFIKSSITCLKY